MHPTHSSVILDHLQQGPSVRHTTKVYDAIQPPLSTQVKQIIQETLRMAPSSINAQPWHYLWVESQKSKEALVAGVLDFNQDKVLTSLLSIVFCVPHPFTGEHILKTASQSLLDRFGAQHGKNPAEEFSYLYYKDILSKLTPEQQHVWVTNQTYLSMGFVMMQLAQLRIDSTPMEGIDRKKIDEIFELKKKGLTSSLVLTLGKGSEQDAYAQLPKSRLPLDQILSVL